MHQKKRQGQQGAPTGQMPVQQIGEPKLTKIADLRPYMKGVNCMFIVLEKGAYSISEILLSDHMILIQRK